MCVQKCISEMAQGLFSWQCMCAVLVGHGRETGWNHFIPHTNFKNARSFEFGRFLEVQLSVFFGLKSFMLMIGSGACSSRQAVQRDHINGLKMVRVEASQLKKNSIKLTHLVKDTQAHRK